MTAAVAIPMALYAALVDAQANVGAVTKDSVNAFHRYKYAAAEDVYIAAKVALAGAGLALLTLGWHVLTGRSAIDQDGVIISPIGEHDRLYVTYRLVHRSGEVLDFEPVSTPVIPEKGRPQDKAEATALTFNLSYFLRGLLLIPRADEGAERAKGRDDVNQRDDSRYEPRNALRQAAKPQERAQPQVQRIEERVVGGGSEDGRDLQAEAERAQFEAKLTVDLAARDKAELAACADLELKMRSAATVEQLRPLEPVIRQALAKQQISKPNFDALVEIYKCVRAELRKGPGVAATGPSLPAENGIAPPANDQTGQVAS